MHKLETIIGTLHSRNYRGGWWWPEGGGGGWKFLKQLNVDLLSSPVLPLPGVSPEEEKAGFQQDTCAPMFVAGLVTIAAFPISLLHAL